MWSLAIRWFIVCLNLNLQSAISMQQNQKPHHMSESEAKKLNSLTFITNKILKNR